MRSIITWLAFLLLTAALTALVILARVRLEPALSSFVVHGSTPDWADGAIPQGLAPCDETHFFFSVHLRDRGSRLYLIDAESMEPEFEVSLPADATHTSGLAYTGRHLIAADYNSDKLYFIDWERTVSAGKCEIEFSIPTNLRGTSACCVAAHDGRSYLVVTDFRNSKTNYVLDLERLFSSRDFQASTVATYRNGGFSQGIAYSRGLLFDANNTLLGFSAIEVVSFEKVLRNQQLNRRRILTPLHGIQDLAFLTGRVLTSDEVNGVFCSFKLIAE